jgi:hypothetical protein
MAPPLSKTGFCKQIAFQNNNPLFINDKAFVSESGNAILHDACANWKYFAPAWGARLFFPAAGHLFRPATRD